MSVETVLVVDDDPGLRKTLQAIVELEGYRCVVAADGLHALDRLGEELPAIILLDLVMPRMDGFAFMAELERRGLRAKVPIIVLTADGRGGDKAALVGADDFVAKPFEMDELLAKVAHLLAARAPRDR